MTAIEYLIQEIKQDRYVSHKSTKEWNDVFRQAKEIEKQQIVTAFINGDNSDCTKEEDTLLYALTYYNETLK
jgi:hypothetical protein